MTFPTFHSRSAGSSAAATSHGVALPEDIQAGDVIIVVFATRDGASVTWDQASAGTWTIEANDEETGYVRQVIAWKIATGDEAGLNLSIATNIAQPTAHHVYRYSGAQDVEVGIAVHGNSRTPGSPILSPSWGAEDTAWLVALAVRITPSTAQAPGSFETTRLYTDSGGGTGAVGVGSAYIDFAGATLNAGNWNLGGTPSGGQRRYVSQMIAVRNGGSVVSPNYLSAATAFYAPTVTQTIEPAYVSPTTVFYAPDIGIDQVVDPDYLAPATAFYTPKIITDVGPEYIEPATTFYAPAVLTGLESVQPAFIAPTTRFYKTLVTGGARTTPEFSDVTIGPFPGAVADLAFYSGSNQGAAFASRWETRGPIGFTDFTAFVAGEYEFSDAVVWMRLTVEPVERVFAITRAKLNIDVPDVIDSKEVDIPEDGAWVEFTRPFYTVPNVVAQVIAAEGVTEVPRATVTDKEATRAFIVLHRGDDLTASIAGRANVIATGF